jgi:hypothetical protein
MANPYGTLSSLDLLATSFQTVAQIGENRAFEAIETALKAHNRIVNEMVADIVDVTTDRTRVYGTAQAMGMDELDEYGTADAQKLSPGIICGFPLRHFGASIQWTRNYFKRATGQELAGQVTGLMDADAQQVIRQIKKAIFTPTNYTFDDRLVNHLNQIQLSVRAFINADGLAMPVGPNGEIFNGSTHNHYLGTASFADADLAALLNTVLEHYARGEARIYINQAQETAVRGFTPNFQQYYDGTVIVGDNITRGRGILDTVQVFNRAIGTYRGAEVWVKPWMPAGLIFCFLKGVPKPLVWRNPDFIRGNDVNALQLVFEDEAHPLRAKGYERDFGVGVWNRTNGAVLDTAHATYTAPTL